MRVTTPSTLVVANGRLKPVLPLELNEEPIYMCKKCNWTEVAVMSAVRPT